MTGRIKGTNVIFFINKAEVPDDRWKDIAYSRVVCNVWPHKAETNRTRQTHDVSKLDIVLDCGTPMVDLLIVKLLLNSVISKAGARFMAIVIKDFYLNTPLAR